jgi:hypothetical protein
MATDVEAKLRLMTVAEDMRDVLIDVLRELEEHSGVVDGPDGTPTASWEMSLALAVQHVLLRAGVTDV